MDGRDGGLRAGCWQLDLCRVLGVFFFVIVFGYYTYKGSAINAHPHDGQTRLRALATPAIQAARAERIRNMTMSSTPAGDSRLTAPNS